MSKKKTAKPKKGYTTVRGYKNRNQQRNLGYTGVRGSDHNQYIYRIECLECGHRYGANGSDIFQRKCPNRKCPTLQGRKPGKPCSHCKGENCEFCNKNTCTNNR